MTPQRAKSTYPCLEALLLWWFAVMVDFKMPRFLRGISQIFPQKRISSPCNIRFNIVFALKSILPKRLGGIIFLKLCYKRCSLLFEITVNVIVVNEILIPKTYRLFLSVFEKIGSQIICVGDKRCCCSNQILLKST